MVLGRSHHMGSVDPVNKVLGTGATNIIPETGRHDPGTTVRERAPPGMLRSLPTSRNGRLESLLVGASIARKVGATSSGIRVHFMAINEIDCLGSATEAVVTGSMAETIFPRTHKGAGP